MKKPKVGIFDFACCEGCQLQIANMGEDVLSLLGSIDVREWREVMSEHWGKKLDIAIVEGSITDPHAVKRIKQIRKRAAVLIAYGSCATIGGVNGMKNNFILDDIREYVYGGQYSSFPTEATRAVHQVVAVDYFIHGCPVYIPEVVTVLKAALQGMLMGSGPFGKIFGGGIFGSIFGGLGFADGGYTGHGGKYEPAGIVHRGEYVMSKAATSRIGVGNLDSLHRGALKGFAAGGYVGDAPAIRRPDVASANAAPTQTISISAPITVEGSSGTPEQNNDLAKKMAREMETSVRSVIADEMRKQSRPGNFGNTRSR